MRGPESHGTPGLHDSKKEAILHVYWAGCWAAWWYLESLVTEVPQKASKPPWPPVPGVVSSHGQDPSALWRRHWVRCCLLQAVCLHLTKIQNVET